MCSLSREDGSTGVFLAAVAATTPQYQFLFSDFHTFTDNREMLPPAKHDVEHLLETNGLPVTARFCHFDAAELQVAKIGVYQDWRLRV